jgi:hypothetical protein
MSNFDPSQYMTPEEFEQSINEAAVEGWKKLRLMLEKSKEMRLKYKNL